MKFKVIINHPKTERWASIVEADNLEEAKNKALTGDTIDDYCEKVVYGSKYLISYQPWDGKELSPLFRN
jgi:hypothetical protein